MKWIAFFVLLILDVAGGWLIWFDMQADWRNKTVMEESFLILTPERGEKIFDEKNTAELLNIEWKSSIPDIF